MDSRYFEHWKTTLEAEKDDSELNSEDFLLTDLNKTELQLKASVELFTNLKSKVRRSQEEAKARIPLDCYQRFARSSYEQNIGASFEREPALAPVLKSFSEVSAL